MGVNGVNFGNTLLYIPGAYSQRNFIPNEGGGVSAGNICIIGVSELAEPDKLLVFGDDNAARATLSAGPGLDGVIAAFKPGNDLTPNEVGFIRINPGTQSQRVLQKTAVDIFTIPSVSWGVPMNQVRMKFSDGTTAGTFKIETEFKWVTQEQDNIEQKSLEIQYVGAGSAAAVTIDVTTLATTITGGPGSEDLSLILADYPTISELAAVIDNNAVYTATVLTGQPTQKSIELDFVAAVSIFATPLTLKSDHQAIFDELGNTVLLGTIVKEGTTRSVPDVDADFVYLTGGTTGTSTPTDYDNALTVAENENIQLIGTSSEDAAIHILIRDHCVTMNSIKGRKERQFYVGGALGESVSEVSARALTLNSSFGSLTSPGYYGFNDAGAETLYSPAYYACQQLGQVSALPLNTPTTSKSPNIIRWEKDYGRTEKENLIKAGVLVGAKDQDGIFITVRSITTYQQPLLQQNEASVMRETLYQDADLRRRTEKALVGSPAVGNEQLATVDSVFERTIKDWRGLKIIVSVNGQLYSGYTRKLVGDQIVIQYNTWNVIGTNFVLITHNILVPVI